PNMYTLAGPGNLILQSNIDPGVMINVTSGSHKILAPMQIYSNATFSISGSSSLTISGALSVAAVNLTKSGSGTFIVNGSQNWSNVVNFNINAGTASLGNVDANGTVTVASGARLNASRVRENALT